MNKFRKKIFTFQDYLKHQLRVFIDLPALISAMRTRRVSKSLEEKIMLATTGVNGCKFCSRYHVRAALKEGIAQKEINEILKMDFNEDIDESESTAILFAQHYAETDGNPEKESLERVHQIYGMEKAVDILLFLRLIYFGNLMGNTYEAFLSRLKGNKAQNSYILSEFIIFLVGFPLFTTT